MDIFCQILQKIVKRRQAGYESPNAIYLGEVEYEELADYLSQNFGIGFKSNFVINWFRGARIYKVEIKNHMNVV